MTIYSYSDLEYVEIDESFNSADWSDDIDNALARGFDRNYPIVLDEDGIIIDGNHRYVAFAEAGRIDELVFVKVDFFEFCYAKEMAIENNKEKDFLYDHEYFYSIIKSIAK